MQETVEASSSLTKRGRGRPRGSTPHKRSDAEMLDESTHSYLGGVDPSSPLGRRRRASSSATAEGGGSGSGEFITVSIFLSLGRLICAILTE